LTILRKAASLGTRRSGSRSFFGEAFSDELHPVPNFLNLEEIAFREFGSALAATARDPELLRAVGASEDLGSEGPPGERGDALCRYDHPSDPGWKQAAAFRLRVSRAAAARARAWWREVRPHWTRLAAVRAGLLSTDLQ
jgi:hypothetical protein